MKMEVSFNSNSFSIIYKHNSNTYYHEQLSVLQSKYRKQTFPSFKQSSCSQSVEKTKLTNKLHHCHLLQTYPTKEKPLFFVLIYLA